MSLVDSLNGQFKKKLTVLTGGEVPPLKRTRTYYAGFDIVTGGGLPEGRIIEICGKFSSGKTALSLGIGTQVLENGGKVLFIDNEQSINQEDITRHRLNQFGENFLYTNTSSSGEMDMDLCMTAANEGVNLVIVDSAANLLPASVVEKLADDPSASAGYGATMGVAQLISRFRRNLPAEFAKTGSTLILINQIRQNTGLYGGFYSPGGKALEHITSIKVELSGSPDKKKEGATISALKVKKNKTSRPFLTSELRFVDGLPDKYYSLITEARRVGVVTGNLTYHELPQELKDKYSVTKKLGPGIDNACTALENEYPKELFIDLYEMVMKMAGTIEQDLSLAEEDGL